MRVRIVRRWSRREGSRCKACLYEQDAAIDAGGCFGRIDEMAARILRGKRIGGRAERLPESRLGRMLPWARLIGRDGNGFGNSMVSAAGAASSSAAADLPLGYVRRF